MTCDQVREWIIDDLTGELFPANRKALDDHLRECSSCAALAREYGALWQDLGSVVSDERNPGLAALQAGVAAEFGQSADAPPPAGARSGMGLALRAAAAVVLIGVGVLVGMELDRSRDTGAEGADMAADADAAQQTDAAEESGTDEELPRFVLLIYGVSDSALPPDSMSSEIWSWAREQFQQGVVLDGEGLTADAGWVGPLPSSGGVENTITHFLRIQALNLSHAQRIAQTVPTVAYGGRIEVRPLTP